MKNVTISTLLFKCFFKNVVYHFKIKQYTYVQLTVRVSVHCVHVMYVLMCVHKLVVLCDGEVS